MAGPQWEAAISPSSALGATGYPSYWLSISERMMRSSDAAIGKQYELDQAQTGEFHATLYNRDAAFLPTNASSPLYPNVVPFRPVRWRAQYPATKQLLTADQASMGGGTPLANGTLATAFGMGSGYDPAAAVVTGVLDAWTGSTVVQVTVPSSPTVPGFLINAVQWAVHLGQPHAFTAHVRIPGGSASATMSATITWVDTNGNVISSTSGTVTSIPAATSTWTTLTVVATPPATAAGGACGITLNTAPSGCVAQVDGFQLELAAAPTTWVMPGTWTSVFTGGAERLPQIYDLGGTFGQVQPVIVDAFSLLSQTYPLAAFLNDVVALGPNFCFPLNDPVGSTSFVDVSGNKLPAPIANSQYGTGTVAPGQTVQAATAGQAFLGTPGPVVTMTNSNTGGTTSQACSWIDLRKAGVTGTPTSGGWTRMIAFRNSGAGSTAGTLWLSGPNKFQSLNNLFFIALGSGASSGLTVEYFGATSGFVYAPPAGSYADGNWHLMFCSLSADGNTFTITIDNIGVYSNTVGSDQHAPAGAVQVEQVGAFAYPQDGQFYDGYNGDVAFVAEFPTVLTTAQMGSLNATWRVGGSPESSDTRWRRILTYVNWFGPVATQAGGTSDMGPATDIDGKTDALTLLQNVVTTENGVHYVRGDGTIVFEARTSRYNKLTPTYTFGENVAGGEWPYEDVAFDYDVTHVIGQAQITQNSTGQIFVANAPTTVAPGFRPTYQRTINVVNPQECLDAANYLSSRFANPQLRVQKIRLHPAAVAGMWPVALALAISMRVRVMRRAPGAPTVQFDGFVERLKWTVDWDTREAFLELEISPAVLQLYWVMAALRTTLKNAATSGTNTITCNPLPDSASNPAAASFCSGLQITLDPGTASAETLTVQSFGATSPGYTSFTITFTANMANNHAINAVVCEKLPTGITDPTTWDSASILGTSTTLAY